MKLFVMLIVLPLVTSGAVYANLGQLQSTAVETLRKSEELYLTVLSQSEMIGLREDEADFSRKLAAVDLELGEYTKALHFIEKALEIYRTLDTSQTNVRLNIIDSRILKGRLLGFLKQFEEAVEELLAVFEENSEIRGENDPETTRLYKHLGWHMGQLAKKGGQLSNLKNSCSELQTLRLALDEKKLAATEIDDQEIFLLAQKCYEKAILDDERRVGKSHPDTAKSYSLVGWILGDRERYSEALEYHMKALIIRMECFSELHPDTARSYSNIGWNYEQLGKYEEAVEYYRLSLRIRDQVFAQEHPETKECQENIERVESFFPLRMK